MRRLAVVALALGLAGCGGDGRGAGTATLWVTRDRGAHVVFEGEVPAGLTAMQALDRKLDLDTRYGGRFVQAIEGISGSLTEQRDWFWYVNGIEGDRSAAEVRLRPGDVEWWDFRSWKKRMSVPVVAGAFPEPFLHGFGWAKPGAVVIAMSRNQLAVARRLARRVHGTVRVGQVVELPRRSNTIVVTAGRSDLVAIGRSSGAVTLALGSRAARRAAENPRFLRFRYGVLQ